MVPPSIHPNGEPVEWIDGYDLDPPTEGPELEQAFRITCIAAILADNWPQQEGSRHDIANATAGWLATREVPQEQTEAVIEAAAERAGDDEARQRGAIVKYSYDKVEKGDKVTGWTTLTKLIDGRAAKELRTALAAKSRFPDLTKDGAPNPKSRFNVMVALELLGIECRYDLFSLRYVVSGHPLAEFVGELSDPMLFRLAELVFERFRLSPAIGVVMEAVQTLANHHRFHPVRDYLDGLEWDGTPRIDSWLVSYGGAGDTPYTRAVGVLTLIAAVRRVREPGCKFDETLVLEGPEGINKSEALRVLAVKSEWFSDSLSFNLKPQEAIEQTTGVWIVEIPELRGLRRSDFDKRKAFQSRREDRARLAYGHTSTRAPRQYVPIATTNEKQYLEDLTGNRRFWPVGVEGFDLEALARDRDQLWAEAASREANGDSIRLPEHLWPEAAEQQQDRMVDNPFVMLLDQTLRELDELKDDGRWVEGNPMQGKIALEDVWTILDIRPGQRTQKHNNDLGAAMKELGWEKKKLRVGGGREQGPRPTHYVRGPQPWRSIVVDPRSISEGTVIPARARYADNKSAAALM
jgi:Virulence-associated protein E-like domain